MIDIFYYYLTTIAFISFITALYGFYTRVLHNKLIDAEKKLRTRINNAQQYFEPNSDLSKDFITESIGNIGIDGIMKELGVDPGILKNPLVKGLVDKYAPKLLEGLTKQKNKSSDNTFELL